MVLFHQSMNGNHVSAPNPLGGSGVVWAAGYSTTVNLAIASASHLLPWRGKFTWARASSPTPSMARTRPSPNLAWKTVWPLAMPPGFFEARAVSADLIMFSELNVFENLVE